jgi:CDP-paratose 2-epimerase
VSQNVSPRARNEGSLGGEPILDAFAASGYDFHRMKILLTGGAGFIGCNAAAKWMMRGDEVIVIDDLSRRGSDKNLAWLEGRGPFRFYRQDIRNFAALSEIFQEHGDAAAVVHLAAQVAVTTSVTEPRNDFEINALGTFNVLEAVRRHCAKAAVVFASTNKVYGSLPHAKVAEVGGRYELVDRAFGIAEEEPLDFHSPYGCSKGAADQYVLDYSRIYGLRTVSLRQSCIYGHRQMGVEDQGWVAWFTIAALLGRPFTIYGDGKQVRDVLFVDDLCDCYDACIAQIDKVNGQAFNVGGGPANRLSLLELIRELERRSGRKLSPTRAAIRPGDQPVFVADVRKAARALDWAPKTSVDQGLTRLFDWISSNRDLFVE